MARLFAVLFAALTIQPIQAAPPTAVYRTSGSDVALTELGSPLVYWAGGAGLTEPRAAQAPNGDTFMVVLDQWGSLYGRIFSAATHQWLNWRQSGGGLIGAPAIAIDPNGTAWVVARSSYYSLWLAPLTYAGFGSWTSLGGVVNSDPAIAISSSGIAHIVARDGAGNVGAVYMVRAQNGVSLGWTGLGGVVQGNPALVAGLNGTVHLITRDPWNNPYVGVISGTSITWAGIGFPVDQDPAGIHVNNVVTMVAARSGQIYSGAANVTNNNPVWGAWSSMGQAGASASAASVQTSLAVAARDLTGQLVWRDPANGWVAYGTNFSGGAFTATPVGSSTTIIPPVTTTITSSPPGLQLAIDGVNCTAPCAYQWIAGSSHTIAAPPSQTFGGSTYRYSYWSDGLGRSHSMTATTQSQSITATMVASADPLEGVRWCLLNVPNGLATPGTCTMPTGAYTVTSSISITRSNTVLAGDSADRNQTMLVRAQSFNHPLVEVSVPRPALSVGIQNLTFCGSSILSSAVSPCPTPSQQTTCGQWQALIDYNARHNLPPPKDPVTGAKLVPCVDLGVVRADTRADTGVNYQQNPFATQGPYSLTVSNCAFNGSTGHAVSLYPTAPDEVNDVFITGSAIKSAEVTGLLVGVNGEEYNDHQVCNYDNFKDDKSKHAPRNIRVEGTTFSNNLTGAMGINAARWFGLRNNNSPGFENNYINPQAGNVEGGTVFFNHCADKVEIHNNTFLRGTSAYPQTGGLELWGRNIDVRNNLISGYPAEGIGANSVKNLSVLQNNRTLDNGTYQPAARGGILVWTSGSGGGCDPTPRDTDTVLISGNTSTGNNYGILLGDRGESTNRISNVTITGDNNLQAPAVGLDANVTLGGTNTIAPSTTPTPNPDHTPRALEVSPRCSTSTTEQTFRFPVADVDLANNIRYIEGVFSVPGDDETGANGPGAPACHFVFFYNNTNDPSVNGKVFLDDPNQFYNWSVYGSSPVGSGGWDLNNGFCKILAGASGFSANSKFLNLDLKVQFLSNLSQNKHIYLLTVDNDGRVSHQGTWKYTGWWATQ